MASLKEVIQADVKEAMKARNQGLLTTLRGVTAAIKQVEIDTLLGAFRQSLNVLLDNPELADEAMIKNKLKEFVLLITKTENAPSVLDFLSAMFKPEIADLKEVVQNNLYSSLSVEEFALLAHMSTSSFKRKFKQTYGESPKKYIAKKKVEMKIRLRITGI